MNRRNLIAFKERERAMNRTELLLLIMTVLTAGVSLYLLGMHIGWFPING